MKTMPFFAEKIEEFTAVDFIIIVRLNESLSIDFIKLVMLLTTRP